MAKASKTAKVLIGATAFGASFFDPDIRWRTQFSAPDPFVVVVHSGKTVLFVSELEYERAKKQARADEVLLIEKLREEFGLPKMAPASAWLPLYLKREGIDTLEVSPFYDTVLKLSKDRGSFRGSRRFLRARVLIFYLQCVFLLIPHACSFCRENIDLPYGSIMA